MSYDREELLRVGEILEDLKTKAKEVNRLYCEYWHEYTEEVIQGLVENDEIESIHEITDFGIVIGNSDFSGSHRSNYAENYISLDYFITEDLDAFVKERVWKNTERQRRKIKANKEKQTEERYQLYLKLKEEFEGKE